MKSLILMLSLLLFINNSTNAQDSIPIEKTVEDLQNYNNNFPREKIYLHLDKPYYSIGEQIWFKAYLTIGNFNLLSSLSKILYVELINPNDEVAISVRLPVVSGITFGDILLTDTLTEGSYRIRAYTNWMRNFNEQYYFDKTIQIGDVLKDIKESKGGAPAAVNNTTKKRKADKTSKQDPTPLNIIKFYPENGENLIAGILNKVVFKATKSNGRGLEAKVIVKDSNNKQIAEFESDFAGIGNFQFYPESNLSYKATINFTNSNEGEVEVNLPMVESQGYILSANTWSSDQVFIQITNHSQAAEKQDVNLILQKNGEVFYAAKIKIKDKESTVRIPKNRLPQGVIEARILTDDMQTLANRKIFVVNEQRELPLMVTADKKEYKARELVKLTLNAGQEGDSIRVATLSVAVTDLTKVPIDTVTETTINSYLNLSSETTDYVQSPNYYFKSEKHQVKAQLDNLVLTFGKDSVWQKIKVPQTEATYTPEQDLRISGKVTRFSGKPVPFAKVLILAGGSGRIIDTVADENGVFNFDRLLFYENTKFVIQARDEKGKKNVEIVLDEVPNQQVSKNKNSPDITLSTNNSMDVYLKNTQKQFEELIKSGKMDNSILLDDVNITVEKKNPAKNSSNLNGAGNADQVLGEDDLSTCSDLSICLQGRLMGVMFKNGVPYSTRSMNTPMQIIVDGMYMDGETLSSISAADVASVEVLRRPESLGVYGSMGAGGVIIITTKRGDGSYNRNLYTPGVVTYSPQGIYETKQFKSPDYSNGQNNSEEQDLRTTIYWNPNIVTNENGEASFEFYTADQPGRYRIVVEGIDLNGRIGRSESYITIVGD